MTKPLLTGVLKTWKEDRGFGFITPDNGGRDIFIHISALGETARRPIPGDTILYNVARDKQGKFRAINASIAGVNAPIKSSTSPTQGKSALSWLLAGVLGLTLLAGAIFIYLRSGGFI